MVLQCNRTVCTFLIMLFCMGSVRLYTPHGSVTMVTWWHVPMQEAPQPVAGEGGLGDRRSVFPHVALTELCGDYVLRS